MFSSIIFLSAYFLPESPRWLYVNNKQEASKAMLTKFHGDGNPDSEWVKLQLNEYEELLEMDGADKRWWDYRALFKNKSTCYRLFCNIAVCVFGQVSNPRFPKLRFGRVLRHSHPKTCFPYYVCPNETTTDCANDSGLATLCCHISWLRSLTPLASMETLGKQTLFSSTTVSNSAGPSLVRTWSIALVVARFYCSPTSVAASSGSP